ncbi:PDZ domain-containing protein [Indioceanicola profundi]|uniref:PDZ domain-containing protein n=1 Tax=Indioceanicola profundi TaxID=2220096 RepID=UPI000E6ABF96|nr:alpha/beta fold hydrolase [Indioceanicola profundi]
MPLRRLAPALALLLIGAGFAASPVRAAEDVLPRTAALGVAPVAVPPELVAEVGEGRGVLVRQVLPALNAERLGVQTGDVILALNGTAISSPAGLVAAIGVVRAGDALELTLWRDGRELTVSGTAVGKPEETYRDASVSYGAVPFQGGRLRDILVLPEGRPDAPVVFIIQGYTCSSVESPSPDFIYSRLTAELLAHGVGTYRVEKSGMGDSRGTPRCDSIDFETELAAFQAGYKAMMEVRGIPPERIFMFGHSMGGLEAPLLAAQGPAPRGVAVYGTVLRNWHDYILDVIRIQDVVFGDGDPVQSAERAESARETLRRFYLEKRPPADLEAEDALHGRILRDFHGWDGEERLFGRHYSYWHQLPEQPLTAAWRDTLAETLVLHGAEDAAAVNDEDHRLIAEVVNHYRPGTACYVEFLETDHGMDRVGSRGEVRQEARTQGEEPAAGNPRVAEVLADWVAATLAKPPLGTQPESGTESCAGIRLTSAERR